MKKRRTQLAPCRDVSVLLLSTQVTGRLALGTLRLRHSIFKLSRLVQELTRGVQKHRLLASIASDLRQPKRAVRIVTQIIWGWQVSAIHRL